MKEIIITKNEQGIKLTKFIKKMFPNMPDSLVYKLFRKKYFEINTKKATGKEEIKNGDKISIFLSDETFDKYKIKNTNNNVNKDTSNNSVFAKAKTNNCGNYHTGHLDNRFNRSAHKNICNEESFDKNRIIYEDENIIIYNKPEGMLSQSDKSNLVSINDILKEYIKIKDKDKDIIKSSGVVNRLDRNTEGLIIFAKNYLTAKEVSKMIKEQKIEKKYKALVNGVIKKDEDELINTYKKDINKNIASIGKVNNNDIKINNVVKLKYKIIKRYKEATLVDINLITGKSHQIRAQFSFIGHPLVCDKKYMDNNLYKKNLIEYKEKSQFLICYKIKFSEFENENLKYLNNKEFIVL